MKHCIEETEATYEYDGAICYDEENILAILLIEEYLWPSTIETKEGHMATTLLVNTSDVFAWGYANADFADLHEMEDLYKLTREDRKWGSIKWICYKDNLQPQYPIVRDMKAAGAWCDKMEALPKNEH